MDAKEFLYLAEKLIKDIKSEVSFRTCVGRSYFALFNLAAKFINDKVVALSNSAADHEKVYHYLNNCGVEDVQDVAVSLNFLRDNRNDADYKLDLNRFDENCATLAFIQARKAIKGFEKAIGNIKVQQDLISGIRTYKQRTNS